MKKQMKYALVFIIIIITAIILRNWIVQEEKQNMASRFIENAEDIWVIKDVNAEGSQESKVTKVGGIYRYMPREVIINAKYKSLMPPSNEFIEAFLMTRTGSEIRVGINESDHFFVVDGISGFFVFDIDALKAWRGQGN